MTPAAPAGSVLPARLATAALLMAGLAAAVFLLEGAGWGWVLTAIVVIAAREWAALAGYRRAATLAYCAATAALAWVLLAASRGPGFELAVYAAGCVFWIAVVPAWLAAGRLPRGAAGTAAAGLLALVPAWLAAARLQDDPVELLQVMAIVWLADTAAFFCGRAFGRHKLAPRVSPGKTWEGVGGAAAAVAVYYVALSASGALPSWAGGWRGGVLFAGVAALSVVGDLFESAMKRQAGVKDSGTLLPGHGGVLDRIDGLVAGLPLAALLARWTG
ncbi:MAG: phosphatidate cytidylyltransferase [Burkholderiales bacterium]|nr:phosphatidate cytidylyltransferase [Burkholderiales bacterium]